MEGINNLKFNNVNKKQAIELIKETLENNFNEKDEKNIDKIIESLHLSDYAIYREDYILKELGNI